MATRTLPTLSPEVPCVVVCTLAQYLTAADPFREAKPCYERRKSPRTPKAPQYRFIDPPQAPEATNAEVLRDGLLVLGVLAISCFCIVASMGGF